MTDGRSSRLIRGETRRIHTAQEQPPSPVAPGARVAEWALPEILIPYAGSAGVKPLDPSAKGRLILSLNVAGTRKTWSGDVHFEPL